MGGLGSDTQIFFLPGLIFRVGLTFKNRTVTQVGLIIGVGLFFRGKTVAVARVGKC